MLRMYVVGNDYKKAHPNEMRMDMVTTLNIVAEPALLTFPW